MRLILRHRVLRGKLTRGYHSFYLDIYRDGKREYESLGVIANPRDKANYRSALQFCQDILAKRQLELKGIAAGIKTPVYGKGDFIVYCEELGKKISNKKSQENWGDAVKSLRRFEPEGVDVSLIDREWLERYQGFLLVQYSQNTARSYSTKIRQAVSRAVQDGYIAENPNKQVRQISEQEGEIKYLYVEEIMLLDKTPHRHNGRRTAFLFNCFVPLRSGDLEVLTESNIRPAAGGGFEVYFRQSKKQRIESIPISKQGMVYLNQARELAKVRYGRDLNADDPIFDIGHKKRYGSMLKTWAQRAYERYGKELPQEIRFHFSWASREISPHWARHTGATMLLNAGASLEAVGEILGHIDRKTTMRYAKIHPQTKRSTIAMMPTFRNNNDSSGT